MSARRLNGRRWDSPHSAAVSRGRRVLAEQVAERLVGKFLEVLHAISREKVERVSGVFIELDSLAGHRGILRASFDIHGKADEPIIKHGRRPLAPCGVAFGTTPQPHRR